MLLSSRLSRLLVKCRCATYYNRVRGHLTPILNQRFLVILEDKKGSGSGTGHALGTPHLNVTHFTSRTVHQISQNTHTNAMKANCIPIQVYRVSQEECARLREGVPYVKVYRYNPKHLCPKLNGYGDNGQRSLKLRQLLHTC